MVRKGIISIFLILAVLSGFGGVFSFNDRVWTRPSYESGTAFQRNQAFASWVVARGFVFERNNDIDPCKAGGWAIALKISDTQQLFLGGTTGRLGICMVGPVPTSSKLQTVAPWRKKQWTLCRADRWQQERDQFLNVCFPFWLPAVLFLTYPLWTLCRFVHHRRNRKGRCMRCNYDLTGNVTGVCPECGAKAPSAAVPGLFHA